MTDAAAPATAASAGDSAVRISREGATVHVRLQRPDKLNALTAGMYGDLTDALLAADADPGVHAVLLSGAGRAFCAGNDLADFLATSGAATDQATGQSAEPAEQLPASRFLRALLDVRVSVVAAVHGRCVGIGATMLLHCDVVVADPTAVLTFPFTALGLVPEAASSLLLPLAVGPALASRLLLLGDPLTAHEALAAGLVTSVTDAGEHLAAAQAVTARLAALPRESLRLTKHLLRAPQTSPAQRMAQEERLFAERITGPDFAAAAAAFLRPR